MLRQGGAQTPRDLGIPGACKLTQLPQPRGLLSCSGVSREFAFQQVLVMPSCFGDPLSCTPFTWGHPFLSTSLCTPAPSCWSVDGDAGSPPSLDHPSARRLQPRSVERSMVTPPAGFSQESALDRQTTCTQPGSQVCFSKFAIFFVHSHIQQSELGRLGTMNGPRRKAEDMLPMGGWQTGEKTRSNLTTQLTGCTWKGDWAEGTARLRPGGGRLRDWRTERPQVTCTNPLCPRTPRG